MIFVKKFSHGNHHHHQSILGAGCSYPLCLYHSITNEVILCSPILLVDFSTTCPMSSLDSKIWTLETLPLPQVGNSMVSQLSARLFCLISSRDSGMLSFSDSDNFFVPLDVNEEESCICI